MVEVLLEYEHKSREIETIIAMKNELSKRNIKAEIVSTGKAFKIKYLFFRPKLVVVPYLYSTQTLKDIVGYICGNVKKVVNLQWEQVYNGSSTTAKRTPKGRAKEAVHLCWGNESYKRLKMEGVENAVLLGPPQMDFLKEGFNLYYRSKEEMLREYGISSNMEILLFISSFSYLTLSKKKIQEINTLVDWDAKKFKEITIRTRDAVFQWFENILDENPNKVIIYRPHPSELDGPELDHMLKKYSNFKVIRDYSVKQWIKVSDIVLNWFSTSGVEAFFANAHCLYLRPIELDEEIDYAMYKNVLKVNNYKDFRFFIENPNEIEKYYAINNIADDINKYYLIDDKYSFMKICDTIVEMLNTDEYDIKSAYIDKKEIALAQIKLFIKALCEKMYEDFPNIAKHTICKNYYISEYLAEHELRKRDLLTYSEEKNITDRINRCTAGE